MSGPTILQLGLYLVVLVGLAWPLGIAMARVYQGERVLLDRIIGWLERGLYRLAGVRAAVEQGWRAYAAAFLAFHLASFLAVYLIQRLQGFLPLDPQGFPSVPPDLAFNTAMSFMTNTNWQSYGGETTMSHFTQMAALTVQNFVSAASGMAVLAALARALARRQAETVGNFWVDLVRGTLYVLLPLSLLVGLVLCSQGVVQTLRARVTVRLLEPTKDADGKAVTEQTLALGPAASGVGRAWGRGLPPPGQPRARSRIEVAMLRR